LQHGAIGGGERVPIANGEARQVQDDVRPRCRQDVTEDGRRDRVLEARDIDSERLHADALKLVEQRVHGCEVARLLERAVEDDEQWASSGSGRSSPARKTSLMLRSRATPASRSTPYGQ